MDKEQIMFDLTVNNPAGYPAIEIQIKPHQVDFVDGALSIVKKNVTIEIHQTLRFGRALSPAEARLMATWFDLAAQTAEQLDELIKIPDDLYRPIRARLEGETVTVEFEGY